MKITKPFCIDDKLASKLSKINASSLVNDLLTEYFDGADALDLAKLRKKLAEKREKKRILMREIRDLSSKIEDLDRKEKHILKLTNQIPRGLLTAMGNYDSWIKFAITFKKEINSLNIPRDKIRETFEEMKGGVKK